MKFVVIKDKENFIRNKKKKIPKIGRKINALHTKENPPLLTPFDLLFRNMSGYNFYLQSKLLFSPKDPCV